MRRSRPRPRLLTGPHSMAACGRHSSSHPPQRAAQAMPAVALAEAVALPELLSELVSPKEIVFQFKVSFQGRRGASDRRAGPKSGLASS